MRLSTAILILFVAGSLGYVAHELWLKHPEPPSPPDPAASVRPVFPVDRVLTDRLGRKVAVRLIARNETSVQFMRESDHTTYNYPIALLSDDDQAFLRPYPTTTLAALPAVDSSRADSGSLAEMHLRRERAELEHKIQLLVLELQKQHDKSPTLSRDQIQQRIHDFRNRIIDIDKQRLEIAFRATAR